jgi:hypothetical protein
VAAGGPCAAIRSSRSGRSCSPVANLEQPILHFAPVPTLQVFAGPEVLDHPAGCIKQKTGRKAGAFKHAARIARIPYAGEPDFAGETPQANELSRCLGVRGLRPLAVEHRVFEQSPGLSGEFATVAWPPKQREPRRCAAALLFEIVKIAVNGCELRTVENRLQPCYGRT